ncbi:uncharacterized protein N7529_003769 [Penicillium soppii]|uniref:uncharacterized protein n=1 Tax=Penicillium soppii TaxID=69789 RepID=UPI00254844D2|nr:uncharacterized protein N7529_003769 [Penicillium soppii]KAJ5871416.1 hypothetical protein N7529_003769 [Penicillium soppii]
MFTSLVEGSLLAHSVISKLSQTHPCSSIAFPNVPGAKVLSVVGVERHNLSIPVNPWFRSSSPVSNLDICDVNVTLTHASEGDTVLVKLYLPLNITNWNGRFQAIGGGGYAVGNSGGTFGDSLATPAGEGFSTGWSDGGHTNNPIDPSSWALTSDGQVNNALVANLATRSVHDLAVVGKAVSASYYGQKPAYSYYNGCSTGGRQGYMEAQKYPHDFDGILAMSPIIYWPTVVPAEYWAQLVMQEAGVFPTQQEFMAFYSAAISACDELDGVKDGIISSLNCPFDPATLLGTTVDVDGSSVNITQTVVDIVKKTLDGPRNREGKSLWYGILPGTPFAGVANTKTTNGSTTGVPFPISSSWFQYFLQKNPEYDTTTMTYDEYLDFFTQSENEYTKFFGAEDPDLSSFKAAGGKLITWHGLSDPAIMPQATINYRKQVENTMGGSSAVNEFYRLFMAPGGVHCAPGVGPTPKTQTAIEALVSWVEDGHAPDTLRASTNENIGNVITRDLCPYPLVARYNGTGDFHSPENFHCAKTFSSEP